ncbi:MAG: hypothetical protein HYY20_00875 [Candidatus Tectomicrobia bacterium]|uniref:IrrE N-terminal-like domain-containing protein n=1 Tax=Tectimicrobiota bacterium TaxID=2528274 RepID=A0A932FXE4_UNCTE|nr:hypothetical protein [Candidatus Tectomicrobia bacterium]
MTEGVVLFPEEEKELKEIAFSHRLILEVSDALPPGTLAKLFIDMSQNGYRYVEIRRVIEPAEFYQRYSRLIPSQEIFRFLLYHEIGHKLFDDCPIQFYLEHGQKEDFPQRHRRRFLENERKADLFAGEQLFGYPIGEQVWTEDFAKRFRSLPP